VKLHCSRFWTACYLFIYYHQANILEARLLKRKLSWICWGSNPALFMGKLVWVIKPCKLWWSIDWMLDLEFILGTLLPGRLRPSTGGSDGRNTPLTLKLDEEDSLREEGRIRYIYIASVQERHEWCHETCLDAPLSPWYLVGIQDSGNSGDQWCELLGASISTRSCELLNPMYYINTFQTTLRRCKTSMKVWMVNELTSK